MYNAVVGEVSRRRCVCAYMCVRAQAVKEESHVCPRGLPLPPLAPMRLLPLYVISRVCCHAHHAAVLRRLQSARLVPHRPFVQTARLRMWCRAFALLRDSGEKLRSEPEP